MNACAFKQVDVFTSRRFFGNALAVILDADRLTGAQMQRIAAWTNLSETAFVLTPTQPGASYRVRIFTPRSELDFAGHPSVGTAHALLEAGVISAQQPLIQECAAGLLPLRVLGDGAQQRIFVRAPRANVAAIEAASIDRVAGALGASARGAAPRIVNLGIRWLICELGDEATLRALAPDMAAVTALSADLRVVGISVYARAAAGGDYALAVRAFAPADGVAEDPVTGSANAAIGAYLLATGQLDAIGAAYRANQGREVGRDGFIDVHVDATTGDVEIGGQSITCIDGTLVMPLSADGSR